MQSRSLCVVWIIVVHALIKKTKFFPIKSQALEVTKNHQRAYSCLLSSNPTIYDPIKFCDRQLSQNFLKIEKLKSFSITIP